MAPSSDRDKGPDDSRDSSENPFIKFKQFADAQIGSLLQGVIGLPSAFNKPGNTTWADIDDDLRRRDELQERQRALRESEARRRNGTTVEEEVQLPIRKSSDWATSSTSSTAASASRRQMDDEGERDWPEETSSAKEWPLYLPITRSLFSRLRQSAEDDVDWNHHYMMDASGTVDALEKTQLPVGWERRKTPEGRTYYVDHNTKSTTWNPASPYRFLLRPEQKSTDVLSMVQHMAYNNLSKTAVAPTIYWGGLSLHADSSLLPYLLFSPYSPLNLSENKQKAFDQPDDFPYQDAFEDLLLLNHGLPMVSRLGNYSSAQQSASRDEVGRAKNGMSWIYALGFRGLLSNPVGSSARSLGSTIMDEIHRSIAQADSQPDAPSREAHTEQDMYDRFLRSASSPSSTSVGVFDALFSDAEKFVKEQLASLENRSESDGPQEPKDADDKHKKSTAVTQPSSDTDRVVSTYTTSNHIKHEDGTVETTLTIRKVFADGRTTVTETSHTELPRSEDESDETTAEIKQSEQPVKKPESGSGKKGWFWS